MGSVPVISIGASTQLAEVPAVGQRPGQFFAAGSSPASARMRSSSRPPRLASSQASLLTATRTGLPPASDDELTSQLSTTHSINHQSLLDAQEEYHDIGNHSHSCRGGTRGL